MDIAETTYEGNGIDGAADNSAAERKQDDTWVLQPVPLTRPAQALYTPSSLKLRLPWPSCQHTTGAGNNSAAPRLTRTKMEGTEIVVFRLATTQEISHLHLSVSVLTNRLFPAKDTHSGIAIAEVLDEVWQQLWLSGIFGKSDQQLWLPRAIRVANRDYHKGIYIFFQSWFLVKNDV